MEETCLIRWVWSEDDVESLSFLAAAATSLTNSGTVGESSAWRFNNVDNTASSLTNSGAVRESSAWRFNNVDNTASSLTNSGTVRESSNQPGDSIMSATQPPA